MSNASSKTASINSTLDRSYVRGEGKASMADNFNCLPPELALLIMESLSSLPALACLVQASPKMQRLFRAHSHTIFRRVFARSCHLDYAIHRGFMLHQMISTVAFLRHGPLSLPAQKGPSTRRLEVLAARWFADDASLSLEVIHDTLHIAHSLAEATCELLHHALRLTNAVQYRVFRGAKTIDRNSKLTPVRRPNGVRVQQPAVPKQVVELRYQPVISDEPSAFEYCRLHWSLWSQLLKLELDRHPSMRRSFLSTLVSPAGTEAWSLLNQAEFAAMFDSWKVPTDVTPNIHPHQQLQHPADCHFCSKLPASSADAIGQMFRDNFWSFPKFVHEAWRADQVLIFNSFNSFSQWSYTHGEQGQSSGAALRKLGYGLWDETRLCKSTGWRRWPSSADKFIKINWD